MDNTNYKYKSDLFSIEKYKLLFILNWLSILEI